MWLEQATSRLHSNLRSIFSWIEKYNWSYEMKQEDLMQYACEKAIFCYHVSCCEVSVLKVMQNKTRLSYSKVCSVSLLLKSTGKRD